MITKSISIRPLLLTLALVLAGSSGHAEPDSASSAQDVSPADPRSERRHRPLHTPPPRLLHGSSFEQEGILERGPDGHLALALPLSPGTRARLARARGLPLSAVPTAVKRILRLSAEGPSPAQIDLRLGARVRAVLARDPSGETFLIDLLDPRGEP